MLLNILINRIAPHNKTFSGPKCQQRRGSERLGFWAHAVFVWRLLAPRVSFQEAGSLRPGETGPRAVTQGEEFIPDKHPQGGQHLHRKNVRVCKRMLDPDTPVLGLGQLPVP